MATAKNRIYVVRVAKDGDAPPDRRLVRAANITQAWRHVAQVHCEAELVSQDELVELAASGVLVEDATAAQPE